MVDIQIFLINVLDALLTPLPKMLLDPNACTFPLRLGVGLEGGRDASKAVKLRL